MAPVMGSIETGRTFVREKHTCESCKVRNKVGKPKAGEGMWAARLHVDIDTLDTMLIAAAEFVELCDEAGEYADAIAFMDWVRPDAISERGSISPVKADVPPVSLAEKRRRQAGAA